MENDFNEELDKKLQELSECQSGKDIDSCLKCDKLIGCEVRKSYVDAVYKSMNSGSSGDFDFDG